MLDNQPIKITTRFSGSEWRHWTALTAGRIRRCWEEKTTRSNRMNFRLQESLSTSFNSVPYIFLAAQATHVHQGSSLRLSQFFIGFWVLTGPLFLDLLLAQLHTQRHKKPPAAMYCLSEKSSTLFNLHLSFTRADKRLKSSCAEFQLF